MISSLITGTGSYIPEIKKENKENHIKISYSISNYSKYFPSLFRYRLIGSNNNWSDWSSKSEVYFENLPHGSYIFEASAKIGNLETNNKIKYSFTIAKPWYLKPLSLIIYFFSGGLILIIINILLKKIQIISDSNIVPINIYSPK